MLLLDTLMGVLCAAGVFGLMVQVGLVANWLILEQNTSNAKLPHLEEAPDGVLTEIARPDGTYLHAYHRGSGPTVILIPDLGKRCKSLTLLWRHFASYGYRVITFDWAGHGDSELAQEGMTTGGFATDLERVIKYYRPKDALLVGHSRGAQVMLRYLSAPHSSSAPIRGWVSLGAPAYAPKRKGLHWPWHQQVLAYGWASRLLKTRLFGWGYAAHSFGDRPSPQQLKAYQGSLETRRPAAFSTAYATYSQLQVKMNSKVPGLILHGGGDQQTPSQHAQRLAKAIPQAECEIIPAPVGHMMVWEYAKPLVERIREFERALTYPNH